MTTTPDRKKVPSRSTKSRATTIAPMRARGRGGEDAPAAEVPTEMPETSADERAHEIAEQAYYLAEARGFEPGHELEDWVAAERLVADRHAGAPRS
jgi:hypothetical protein